jgi:sec-independent protein translocase protein TatA
MILNNIQPVLLAMPGMPEMIMIIIAILILFGGRKIPELMRGLGKGIREFNDAKNNVKTEIEDSMNESDKDRQIRELKQQISQKEVSK